MIANISGNQKGFTIAGVMVASAILGIIALAAMSVIGDIVKAGGKAKFDHDIINELELLKSTFKKGDICTPNLKDVKITNNWVTLDKNKLNFRLPSTTNPNILGTQSILGIEPVLQNMELRLEPGQNDIARARLRFDSKTSVLGPKEVYREMLFNVEVDPTTNNLITCATYNEGGGEDPHGEQGRGCDTLPELINGNWRNKSSNTQAVANSIKEEIKKACNAQVYPMKSNLVINSFPTVRGPSSLLFNKNRPSPNRGKYKTKQDCLNQYLFNEADTYGIEVQNSYCSRGPTTAYSYVCINKKWVLMSYVHDQGQDCGK